MYENIEPKRVTATEWAMLVNKVIIRLENARNKEDLNKIASDLKYKLAKENINTGYGRIYDGKIE